MQLLPPLRFRFADPADVAAYGDGWWPWDEGEIARLRSRDLIPLEELVDIPIKVLLREFRNDNTEALTAVMWLAMHRAGHPVTFADFNPAAILVDWEADPLGRAGSGVDPTPDSNSSSEPTPASATS